MASAGMGLRCCCSRGCAEPPVPSATSANVHAAPPTAPPPQSPLPHSSKSPGSVAHIAHPRPQSRAPCVQTQKTAPAVCAPAPAQAARWSRGWVKGKPYRTRGRQARKRWGGASCKNPQRQLASLSVTASPQRSTHLHVPGLDPIVLLLRCLQRRLQGSHIVLHLSNLAGLGSITANPAVAAWGAGSW